MSCLQISVVNTASHKIKVNIIKLYKIIAPKMIEHLLKYTSVTHDLSSLPAG